MNVENIVQEAELIGGVIEVQDSDCLEANFDNTNRFLVEDLKNIEFIGTTDQITALLRDWSLYFGETENPENTTKNVVFGGAKYSPLNVVLKTIRPILSKYGLAIIQTPPYMIDGIVYIKTLATHKDGGMISFPSTSHKLVRPENNKAITEIQCLGSISSYLRRFSINSIVGIMGEIDDDGNIGNLSPDKSKSKSPKTPKSTPLKNEMIELCKEKAKINRELVVEIISKYGEKDGLALSINDEKEIQDLIKELKTIKGE